MCGAACKAVFCVAVLAAVGGGVFLGSRVLFTPVYTGHAVAVYDMATGDVEVVSGPTTVFNVGKDIRPLHLHTASATEYLHLGFVDGSVLNVPGPAAVLYNPLKHAHVFVRDAVSLNTHEVLVVYRPSNDSAATCDAAQSCADPTDTMTRHIIHGPTVYTPAADETVHEFLWTGSLPDRPGQFAKKMRRFNKLRIVPTQLSLTVDNVRTVDDGQLKLQLMVFIQLSDVDRMLDSSHDPIAALISAVSADTVAFAAGHKHLDFTKSDVETGTSVTSELSQLSTFKQLTQTADRIGYTVTRVVYRGYEANRKLQAMADEAITQHTELRLQADTERMQQDLHDMTTQRLAARAEIQRQSEREAAEHQRQLQLAEAEQAMKLERARHTQDMEAERERLEVRRQHYEKLASLGVDVTAVLVAEQRVPDTLVELGGGASGGDGPNTRTSARNASRTPHLHVHA